MMGRTATISCRAASPDLVATDLQNRERGSRGSLSLLKMLRIAHLCCVSQDKSMHPLQVAQGSSFKILVRSGLHINPE